SRLGGLSESHQFSTARSEAFRLSERQCDEALRILDRSLHPVAPHPAPLHLQIFLSGAGSTCSFGYQPFFASAFPLLPAAAPGARLPIRTLMAVTLSSSPVSLPAT